LRVIKVLKFLLLFGREDVFAEPLREGLLLRGRKGGDNVRHNTILVDGAMTRSIILCRRHSDRLAITDGDDGLDRTFSKSSLPDDNAALEILKRARDDLGSAGGRVIDENGERVVTGATFGLGTGAVDFDLARTGFALGREDDGAGFDKLAADIDRAI